jgi:hypothetical protein
MKNASPALIALLALGLLGLTGCQSVKVASDYDETVDFAGYQTFDWMPEPRDAPRNPQINDIMDNRIKRAIEAELIADGYQKNQNGQPDLYVVYHTAVQRQIDRAYIERWGYGRRGRFRRTGTVRVESYKEGTLIIDLVDAERRDLVWRGTATGAVNDLSQAEKKIFGAVERIFATFPPSPEDS